VIPKDVWKRMGLKGSPNTWENMVSCHKERNFRKGNNLNGKMGFALLRRPKAPRQVPISALVKKPILKEHEPFFS
jgi:hypothetical protein